MFYYVSFFFGGDSRHRSPHLCIKLNKVGRDRWVAKRPIWRARAWRASLAPRHARDTPRRYGLLGRTFRGRPRLVRRDRAPAPPSSCRRLEKVTEGGLACLRCLVRRRPQKAAFMPTATMNTPRTVIRRLPSSSSWATRDLSCLGLGLRSGVGLGLGLGLELGLGLGLGLVEVGVGLPCAPPASGRT